MMNWNLIRSYLMVAEHGSTLAAAKHLAVTQSTISRHLTELEAQLSVQLFDRRKTGLVLTDKGNELLDYAKQMDSVADRMQADAAHFSSTVSGTVRVSASEALAVDVLPYCIESLLTENPELNLEIVASNEASNLLSREADIALRMFPPQQQDLISRHLIDIPVAFFAHTDYLKKHGVPASMEDLKAHRFIGFDISTVFIDGARQVGIKFRREDFQIRTDSVAVQQQCAQAGLGLIVMQVKQAGKLKALRKIETSINIPPLRLHIVAQQELRSSRKLRVVYDGLAEALCNFYSS